MGGSVFGTRRRQLIFTTAAAAIAVLAGVPAQAFASQEAHSAAAGAPAGCSAPVAGQVTCAALVPPGGTAVSSLAAGTPPAGISPANLRDAYGFQSSSSGMRQTVAVVVPYDNATAETDMGTYRSQYSIPPCTTADGCFSKVNETGGTSYPPAGAAGWALATAESLDMISAVCPNCHILLVEASTPAITDLGAAENEAVSLGARFVTNTWLTPEATFGTSEPTYDSSYFNHPGVAITAPDGNSGYGTYYPAASPDVTAVGGTTLTASSTGSRGWTETAWSGTGAGCSPYEAKPSWQADTGCTARMLNDVAALADPGTPIAAYDTTNGGWVPGGGTVVASTIVAAAYALAGTPAAGSNPASYPYAHTGLINDITTGSDGTCSPAPGYFCGAGTGYDGPTGVGTPASAIPFSSSGTSPAGEIRSGIAGKCLDDYLGGTADTNKVDIYACNGGTASQQWTVQADGTIRIDGKCLDNHNNGAANGNPVQLYQCIGSPAQQWRPRYPSQLENPSSGKCLNDPAGSTTDGTQLIILDCQQTPKEEWSLPYATPTSPAGEITSGVPAPGSTTPGGECLDNLRGFTTDGNKVDIWSCNGGSGSQLWTVAADGTIRIQGKCLNNSNSGTANHNPVDLWTCNGHDAEQWLAQSDGSLLNPETGKCLDDTNGTTTNGIQIGVYTCIESAGQKWTLPS
jgi:hypothetical protein